MFTSNKRYLSKDIHTYKLYANYESKMLPWFTLTKHGLMHITPTNTYGWTRMDQEDGRYQVERGKDWLYYMQEEWKGGWRDQTWFLGQRQTWQTIMTKWTVNITWNGWHNNFYLDLLDPQLLFWTMHHTTTNRKINPLQAMTGKQTFKSGWTNTTFTTILWTLKKPYWNLYNNINQNHYT